MFQWCFLFAIFSTALTFAHLPTQKDTVIYRKHLDGLVSPKCVSVPEGTFVYSFHPTVETWLSRPIDLALLKTIQKELRTSLEIPLTKEGFTRAVSRQDEFADVSYSAVWVRDACWHYYGLKISEPKNAATLMKNLLRFYSSKEQISRFIAVIQKPEIANPDLDPMAHMNVPLIRFSSKTLSHHQIEGKNEEWNHLQFDSHGLFLLALSDALSSGVLKPGDLTTEDYEVLALFPAFFTQTSYADKGDAGPWEENLQYNASSAGLVAAGIKRFMDVFRGSSLLNQGLQKGIDHLKEEPNSKSLLQKVQAALTNENIQNLYQQGMKRVERNLRFGGEAPNLDGKGADRRADAALFFLCLVDYTPFFDHPGKIKEILNINASLVGPYGIYRYKYDPYQSLNYWIASDIESPISGVETPLLKTISWWKKGYMPHRHSFDAQWFFDSCIADIYYHLSILQQEPIAKAYYLRHGDIHLKRSLGQLTGTNAVAANGDALGAFLTPESINTIWDSYYSIRALPSPIVPLNWAKATLQMALARAQMAHSVAFQKENL